MKTVNSDRKNTRIRQLPPEQKSELIPAINFFLKNFYSIFENLKKIILKIFFYFLVEEKEDASEDSQKVF